MPVSPSHIAQAKSEQTPAVPPARGLWASGRGLIRLVAHAGVPTDLPERAARRLIVTNIAACGLALLSLAYAPLLGIIAHPLLGIFMVPLALLFLVVIVLNLRGAHRLSRFFLLVNLLGSVGVIAVMLGGSKPLAHLVPLAMCVLPILIFSPKERWLMSFGLSLAVVEYFEPTWARQLIPSLPLYPIPHDWLNLLAVGTALFVLLLLLYAVAYVSVTSEEAQQALASLHFKQGLHAQNSPLAFIEFETSGSISSWNKAAEKLFGYTADEAIGMNVAKLRSLDQEQKSRSEAAWSRLLATQQGVSRISACVNKSGHELLVESFNTPLVDRNGQTIGLASILRDVTAEVRADEELKKSEQLFKATFELAKIGICHVSVQGMILRCNPAYADILGYASPDELTAVSVLTLTHPDDLASSQANLLNLGSGQLASMTVEKRFVKKDGSTVWCILSVNTVRKADSGDIDYQVAALLDVSDKVKNAIIIQEQRQALVSTAKMAALGEMAGGIAHEINNPLAIICGKSAQMLKRAKEQSLDPDFLIAGLETIGRTSDRIVKIIRGLKVFARQGELDPLVPTDIASLINDSVELCGERLKNHNVALRVDLHGITGSVPCRPSQVSQVLLNLISNADDAMERLPHKWIEIDVTVIDGKLIIGVTDSGLGIPSELAEKMMAPFFTTKEVGKGTGLGLSISKGIIEEHGGVLRYDPSCRHTRFVIELPMERQALKPAS